MSFINRKYLYVTIFLILISIIYNKWIFQHSILSFGDWYFFHNESLADIRLRYFNTWLSDFSFGRVVLDLGQAPTYSLYGVLYKLFNLDYIWGERIVHLWPIIIFTPLSSYVFLQKYFKNKLAILIGVLFYTFNTYFLTLQVGHLTLMAAFSLTPLVFYFYQEALEKVSIPKAIITALVFFGISAYEPRVAYIVFWLLYFYFLYFLFTEKIKLLRKENIKLFFISGLPFILLALLNIYWILGLASIGVITSNELFDRSIYGGNLFNILYSFTLYHPFWTGGEVEIFSTEQITPYFWVFPFLAIFGFVLNRKNKIILFFGIIMLVGIFLSKQSDVPFANVYSWLYQNVPGFNAFREASKFYSLVALSYSILISSFFSWLLQSRKDMKVIMNIGRYLFFILTIIFLLFTSRPVISGEVGTLFKGREVPKDFMTTKNFIVSQDEYFRTLWVPSYSRWSIFTSNHPGISMINLVNLDWKKFIDTNTNDKSTFDDTVRLIRNDKFKNLLNLASIKYVVVSIRVKDNQEDWIGPVENRKVYIKELDNTPYLRRINANTGEIVIYENKTFRPHIYYTEKNESINNPPEYTVINYEFINPSEYKIKITNLSKPVYLQFSENYHPSWKLRVGDFEWFKAITNSKYFLSDSNHFNNEAGFHSFYIDPKEVCNQFTCMRNTDGSYTINMTLFFKPQSYLYLGMIISVTTLLICLGSLIYYGIKKAKNKTK